MTGRILRSAAGWAALVAVPAALLAGLAVFAGLGGFRPDRAAPAPTATTPAPQATGPVPVSVPALAPPAAGVCRTLMSRLPASVRDRARRPVSAGAGQNAAYGDPPITLACGVPPASFPPTAVLYGLDRVCWHAAEAPEATVWTTADRGVPVRVTVPRAYTEPGQWVIAFSDAVAAAVPRAPAVPAGCS